MDEYVYSLFDRLHAMPEIGFEEYRTAAFLAGELEKHGFATTRDAGGKTGVVGVIKGREDGLNVALRADMDALPFEIDGRTVAIHACGHDAHSAMVMAAAAELAHIGVPRGTLTVVFQPAEERSGGSRSMIDSGLLDEVDEMIGIHIRPETDFAFGCATPAVYHSASSNPRITIGGLVAHGANPHMGVNAVEAAVLAVNAVNAIHGNPGIRHSVKVTKIVAGDNANNTIPGEVFMVLDLRSHDNEEMERLIEKVRIAVSASAHAIDAKADFQPITYSLAAVYDDGMKRSAQEAIIDTLGAERCMPDLYINGGEDFHLYSKLLGCRAVYIGIGAGAAPNLHHRDMTFRREAMALGKDILIRTVRKRMER